MRWIATTAVAALAVLLLTAVPTGAQQTVSGRINVTATLTQFQTRSLLPAGRAGDAATQAWRVNDQYGHTIGRLLMICRWVVPHQRFCNGELRMPLGKIVVAGASPTASEGEYAVVGGTQIYSGGGGSMVWFRTQPRKSVLLINITT